MQEVFPCGAKGSPGFCPGVCQYGKFCKIKDRKKPEPRGLPEEDEGKIVDITEKKPKIDFYY